MPLSIAIVGLPNVGKSTLFNALTKNKAEASNYPFCTIDPNVGVVSVPDDRLEKIAQISKPEKIIPTIIEFVDIAGLVKGAHKGEGLGNKFLHNIRECDAICEVVRDFPDKNIIHVHGRIDPEDDKETINLELIMADLATVNKVLERIIREAKSGDKKIKLKLDFIERLQKHLDAGQAARLLDLREEEREWVRDLHLLSIKPIIYVINNNETSVRSKNDEEENAVILNIKQEEEIAGLDEEDRAEFISELGLESSGLDKLVRASYRLLGLITFFTTGTDETRAWTVKQGAKAPQAAGVIHTDFEKSFIRAEVYNWEILINTGGEAAAREKGLIRTEGKEYVMRDGDVCHFLCGK